MGSRYVKKRRFLWSQTTCLLFKRLSLSKIETHFVCTETLKCSVVKGKTWFKKIEDSLTCLGAAVWCLLVCDPHRGKAGGKKCHPALQSPLKAAILSLGLP